MMKMMRNKTKRYTHSPILLGALSFIITLSILLILLEVVARVAYPLYADYNTEMWRYAVEVKQPTHNPNVSHEHRPNVCSNLYGAEICTDSHGFRGTGKDFEIPKPKNVFRILLVGDSVILGWGVEDNNTLRARLEKKLNSLNLPYKFEVINSGVGNYNSQMEYELFKSKGIKTQPDLVIVGYYINDAELTKKPSTFMLWLKEHSYLYAFLWDKYANLLPAFDPEYTYTKFYNSLYKKGFKGREIAEKSLKSLIELSEKNGIPVLVMVFPEFHNFKDYEFGHVTDFVKNITQTEGAEFLDLLPYYKPYRPRDIWVSFEDAHPNSLGNRIAANALFETLINRKLIPVNET